MKVKPRPPRYDDVFYEGLEHLDSLAGTELNNKLKQAFKEEIHADAREATARQVFKAILKEDRPNIKIALILQAIDDWYIKGLTHGK